MTDHPSTSAVRKYYSEQSQVRAESSDAGRARAEAARNFRQTELSDALGDVGGNAFVELPVVQAEDIICSVHPSLCASGSKAPPIMLLKIDARGREVSALLSLQNILASSNAPLNVVLELNKQHSAVSMRLASAKAAAAGAGIELPELPDRPTDEELVAGLRIPSFALTEDENVAVGAVYVGIVQQFLELGYEVLVADRGWWAAQDPWRQENLDSFKPLKEGITLDEWSIKFNMMGEVDIC